MSSEPFDYKNEADLLFLLAQGVTGIEIDFKGLIEAQVQAETLGPILDPTAYMKSTGDYKRFARAASVLMDCRNKLDDIFPELNAKKKGSEVE